jgi:hypothetical protein
MGELMGRATFGEVWLDQGIERGSWNLDMLPMGWAVGQKDVREEGQMYQDNGEEN